MTDQIKNKAPLDPALESEIERDPSERLVTQAPVTNDNPPVPLDGSNNRPPKLKCPSFWVEAGTGRQLTITGRNTAVLDALVNARDAGLEWSAMPGGVMFSLAARIFELRHEHHLEIETQLVPHYDGRHARYRLISRLTRVPAPPPS